MTPTPRRPPSVEGWEAQYLQAQVFPCRPIGIEPALLWKEVTGEEPEAITTTRKKFQLEERGPYRQAALSITTDLMRTACALTPKTDPDDVPAAVPTLGGFQETQEWFSKLVCQWLVSRQGEVERLAFDAKLLRYTESRGELYAIMGEYLQQVTVGAESSDLLYRINRRRKSAVLPLLKSNRLSTWSAMKFALSVQGVQASGEATSVIDIPERSACVVELDINADQDHTGALPKEAMPLLFGELVALGAEIAEKGDIS